MKLLNNSKLVIMILSLALLFSFCGGKAEGEDNTCPVVKEKPNWLGSNKADKDGDIRVTSSYESLSIAQAEELAEASIYKQLSQIVVSRVMSDTSIYKKVTEEREENLSFTEKSYKKVIDESINVGSESILRNVVISNSYCENFKKGDKQFVRIHKLCDYSKKDLEKAKKEYYAFLNEKVKSAMKTFKNAMNAKKTGEISLCLQSLQDSAVYAEGTSFELIEISDNDYPNISSNQLLSAEIKNQLQSITKNISLNILNGNNLFGNVGDKLPEPIKVKLVYNDGKEIPLANVPVSFKMKEKNGELSPDKQTNELGEAKCEVSKIEFSKDVNEIEIEASYESLPKEYFNHLKKVVRFKSVGRGLLVAVLEEDYIEDSGKNNLIKTKEFSEAIINILNKKGLKDVSEKDFSDEKALFEKLHSNDLSAIERVKKETGAVDIITCHVKAITSGVAHPMPGKSSVKALFYRTQVELKLFAGKDSQISFTLAIDKEKSKEGEFVRTEKMTEDTFFRARTKSLSSALKLFKKKFEDEFKLELIKK